MEHEHITLTPSPIVLLDDDDGAIRQLLTDLMTDEGFTVHGAKHGQAALDLLASGLRPDFILLDLMMPVLWGGATYLTLKADPPCRRSWCYSCRSPPRRGASCSSWASMLTSPNPSTSSCS